MNKLIYIFSTLLLCTLLPAQAQNILIADTLSFRVNILHPDLQKNNPQYFDYSLLNMWENHLDVKERAILLRQISNKVLNAKIPVYRINCDNYKPDKNELKTLKFRIDTVNDYDFVNGDSYSRRDTVFLNCDCLKLSTNDLNKIACRIDSVMGIDPYTGMDQIRLDTIFFNADDIKSILFNEVWYWDTVQQNIINTSISYAPLFEQIKKYEEQFPYIYVPKFYIKAQNKNTNTFRLTQRIGYTIDLVNEEHYRPKGIVKADGFNILKTENLKKLILNAALNQKHPLFKDADFKEKLDISELNTIKANPKNFLNKFKAISLMEEWSLDTASLNIYKVVNAIGAIDYADSANAEKKVLFWMKTGNESYTDFSVNSSLNDSIQYNVPIESSGFSKNNKTNEEERFLWWNENIEPQYRKVLFDTIKNKIYNEPINLYDKFDFNKSITKNLAKNEFYSNNQELSESLEESNKDILYLNAEDICFLSFLENWTWDNNSKKINKKVFAFSPVKKTDVWDNLTKLNPLFWIKPLNNSKPSGKQLLTGRIKYKTLIMDPNAETSIKFYSLPFLPRTVHEAFLKEIFNNFTSNPNSIFGDELFAKKLSTDSCKRINQYSDKLIKSVNALYFLEEWYIDYGTMEFEKKVIAIAPTIVRQTESAKTNEILFWYKLQDENKELFYNVYK